MEHCTHSSLKSVRRPIMQSHLLQLYLSFTYFYTSEAESCEQSLNTLCVPLYLLFTFFVALFANRQLEFSYLKRLVYKKKKKEKVIITAMLITLARIKC